MKYVIFAFLISMIYTGFLIWITAIHNKVNELVDEVNKIKQAQGGIMKDRFKFRVWNGKEILYNSGLGYGEGNQLIEDKGHIIMQYIGLKDINGKLIYEGDILKFYAQSIIDAMAREPLKERIGVAVWNEEELKFDVSVNGEAVPDLCKKTDDNNFEIIGNIYENKELLEEQK